MNNAEYRSVCGNYTLAPAIGVRLHELINNLSENVECGSYVIVCDAQRRAEPHGAFTAAQQEQAT